MSNRKSSGIAFISALAVISLALIADKALWTRIKNQDQEIAYRQEEKSHPISGRENIHQAPFEDQELFFKSVGNYPAREKSAEPDIMGGIVPHHLLPSFIIADFFSRLSSRKIDTLVLVGPNHYERGGANVITSHYSWETPLGILSPDDAMISDLEKKGLVKADEQAIPLDHSMTAIMPFIKHYLPDTKIVPLILSRKMEEGEIAALSEELKKRFQGSGAVMVASVDFSHYLPNVEAKQKNEESLLAINKRFFGEILSFGNDHMDSPPSIVLLLTTMDALGASKSSVLYDTNSGELLGDDKSGTTSYLSLIFGKGI